MAGMHAPRLASLAAALALALVAGRAAAQPYSQLIVFGDSLSDDGNIANLVENQFAFRYPGELFNYADGRFTNNGDTDPSSARFAGVWHEQLASAFLGLPPASNSLDNNGMCFAYGGATSRDGQTERTVISNPTPFGGGRFTITIDNLGKQVDNFLASRPMDGNALFIVWAGGNDLFDDASPANIAGTAQRIAANVVRLARAGARHFLVPNQYPLGNVPHYKNQPEMAAQLNAASASFRDQLNAALDGALATLAGEGIQPRLHRLDIFTLGQQFAASPRYYGFSNVRDASQDEEVPADNYSFWDDLHPSASGHYAIAAAAARILAGGDVRNASLTNLSGRARVEPGDGSVIAGFVISGNRRKITVVRGLGPTLAAYGLSPTIINPFIRVFNAQGVEVGANDNWRSGQEAVIQGTGLAPAADLEATVVLELEPGAYTAVLSGTGGESGVGLVEVYDIDPATSTAVRPINLSTRARVRAGQDVLIAGFVISGFRERRVILRGLGPSLAAAGVSDALADPDLTLYTSNGDVVASNDDWRSSQEAEIAASGLAPTQGKEAAIVRTLPPGSYTAIVRGKAGGTGTALVEVYDLE